MNEMIRCAWAGNMPIYIDYHDNECELPASTVLSDQICKDLKKLGFKFVGSTIVCAFMQATGMVNDHVIECFAYKEVNDEDK